MTCPIKRTYQNVGSHFLFRKQTSVRLFSSQKYSVTDFDKKMNDRKMSCSIQRRNSKTAGRCYVPQANNRQNIILSPIFLSKNIP